jgi:hypothetical protein
MGPGELITLISSREWRCTGDMVSYREVEEEFEEEGIMMDL